MQYSSTQVRLVQGRSGLVQVGQELLQHVREDLEPVGTVSRVKDALHHLNNVLPHESNHGSPVQATATCRNEILGKEMITTPGQMDQYQR